MWKIGPKVRKLDKRQPQNYKGFYLIQFIYKIAVYNQGSSTMHANEKADKQCKKKEESKVIFREIF